MSLRFSLLTKNLKLSDVEVVSFARVSRISASMSHIAAATVVMARITASGIWLNASPKDRVLSETLGLIDQLAINLARIETDVANLSDVAAIAVSTGFIDAASLLDSAAISVGLTAVDSVAFSEELSFVIQSALLDTITVQEQHAIALSRPTVDSIAVAEQYQLSLSRPANDSLSTADENQRSVGKAVSDDAVPTDTTALLTRKSASDVFTLGDQSHSVFGKQLDDTSIILDSLERMVQFQREFADIVSVDDFSQVDKQWSGTKQNVAFTTDLSLFGLSKVELDEIALSDSTLIAAQKVIADTATLSETFHLAQDFIRSFADTVNISDSTDVSHGRTLDESDNAATTDFSSFALGSVFNEVTTASDTAAYTYTKPLNDVFTVAESVVNTVSFQRSFSDTISIEDISNVDKNWDATKQNVAITSDSSLFTLGKTHTDSVLIGDAHVYAVSKGLTDSVGSVDTISIQLNSGYTPVFNGFTFNSNTFG